MPCQAHIAQQLLLGGFRSVGEDICDRMSSWTKLLSNISSWEVHVGHGNCLPFSQTALPHLSGQVVAEIRHRFSQQAAQKPVRIMLQYWRSVLYRASVPVVSTGLQFRP